MAGKVAICIVYSVVVFYSGYSYRDHKLRSNTVIRHNVEVLEVYNPQFYRLKYLSGDIKWFKSCPWLFPYWKVGTVLKDLKYEDRGWCKNLAPGSNMNFSILTKEGEYEQTARTQQGTR